MRLTWYGLSCFYLKGKTVTVLMDPFDDSCGYPVPHLTADIWTSSHDHYDHNYKAAVTNESVLDGSDGLSINGAVIHSVRSYHDKVQGKEWGDNYITIVEIDNLRIAHLGDLGHELDRVQLEQLGQIDILLIPTGGIFTIDEMEAARVAQSIKARLTIPMHYRTHHLQGFELHQGLDIFLEELGYPYQFNEDNNYEITEKTLPDQQVIVLKLA